MKFRFLISGLLLIILQQLSAQEKKDSVIRFSLKEAQDYALKNSPTVKNSILDLEAAKKKIWETTAYGLPQISGKLTYGYTLEQSPFINEINSINKIGILPDQEIITSIRLDSIINPASYTHRQDSIVNAKRHEIDSLSRVKPGDYKNSVTFDLTISQLIFSGSYLVGLQTSRVYKGLSELAITKSQQDLKESVSNSYFLVLITRENRDIMDSTYKNTEQIVENIISQYQQGFVEETFVDQMKINLANLKSGRDMLTRQLEIVLKLFNFQIGLDLNSQVEFSDSISSLVGTIDYSLILNSNYDVETSTDYKLIKTQERLQELNVKYQKSMCLPTIAGYYNYHKQLNKDYPDFQPPQMIGLTASVPIFTSGQNLVKIKQANIQLEKTKNSNWQATEGLKIDFEQSRSNYISSIDKYNTQKKNLELAKRIYNLSLIKLKNGVISSTDMVQVQNQYLQTQADYYSAINDLSKAKSKFEKIINQANN